MQQKTFTRKLALVVSIVAALTAGGFLAVHLGLHHELRLLLAQSRNTGPHADAIGLSDYRVVVEAKPVAGLDDDISALTFDPDRRTLFTVTNKNPTIIELSLQGEILRQIRLEGMDDPEAIEYLQKDQYVITDEREQRLVKVHIDENSSVIHAADFQQLALGIGLNGNKGFEGLAYDHATKRLFVAKERDPVRIYEISGFPHTDAERPMAVNIVDDPERNVGLFVSDLSSLQFDQGSGHLLALSDQSRLILELDVTGWPIDKLSLKAGRSGLKKTVPQAEGVAMDDESRLYVVSEPNLFYIFQRQ